MHKSEKCKCHILGRREILTETQQKKKKTPFQNLPEFHSVAQHLDEFTKHLLE